NVTGVQTCALPISTRSSVDPALGPARARPAATSGVLPRCVPVRARLTADRGIAVVLQGVDEDLVLGHVGVHVLLGPTHERIDLGHLLTGIPLHDGGVATSARVLTAQTGQPGG